MASILDTRRAKKNGEFPVKIRVTYRRKRKYFDTGKDLSVGDWDKLDGSKSPALVKVRQNILSTFNIVCGTVENLANDGAFSFEALKARLEGGLTDTLGTAFKVRIEAMRSEDRIGNMIYYDNAYSCVKRFAGDKTPLAEVNVDWLKRFDKFMRNEGKSQTLAVT